MASMGTRCWEVGKKPAVAEVPVSFGTCVLTLEMHLEVSWRGGKRELEFAKWRRESMGHRDQKVDLERNVLGL